VSLLGLWLLLFLLRNDLVDGPLHYPRPTALCEGVQIVVQFLVHPFRKNLSRTREVVGLMQLLGTYPCLLELLRKSTNVLFATLLLDRLTFREVGVLAKLADTDFAGDERTEHVAITDAPGLKGPVLWENRVTEDKRLAFARDGPVSSLSSATAMAIDHNIVALVFLVIPHSGSRSIAHVLVNPDKEQHTCPRVDSQHDRLVLIDGAELELPVLHALLEVRRQCLEIELSVDNREHAQLVVPAQFVEKTTDFAHVCCTSLPRSGTLCWKHSSLEVRNILNLFVLYTLYIFLSICEGNV